MSKSANAKKLESFHQPTVVDESDYYVVLDNFLPLQEFRMLWNYFQVESFMRVDSSGYNGQWLLEDAGVMRGPTVGYLKEWHAKFPTGSAVDFVMESILRNAPLFQECVGVYGKDWEDFTAFPSLYPREMGLLWHRDSTDNTGSYTYYAHPEWNIEWGGHLLIADQPVEQIPEDWGVFLKKPDHFHGADRKITWSSHLDNKDASEALLKHGVGYYVMPKPNRLVLIKGGSPHAVTKVSPSAGLNMRASISGFFKKKP